MNKLIDLSHIIRDQMPVFPGDDPTGLFSTRSLRAHGYNDHRLETGMHAGTHIDGPMHLTSSQDFISNLPLESFIGSGCLLDVRGQPRIGFKAEYESSVIENSIVLLHTGLDKLYGRPEYFQNYPVVEADLCDLFIRKHIKLLGMDSPSPDKHPYPIHQSLLKNGIYILENLTHLDLLPTSQNFEVIALPLNIRANGSPARVIARIL